jgi:hypothetical protein
MRHYLLLAAFAAFSVAVTTAPHADELTRRYTIWDIHIGEQAAAIPDEFVNYACGTNGGPPAIRLKSFADFKKCKPEADGLHEVYFEYDDELEYRARALELPTEIKMYAGTTVFEFPVVASLLIDDAGRVRGERMVTDPRQDVSRSRFEFWQLGNFLRQRFGDDHWNCRKFEPEEGETPIGSLFIKTHCEKTANGLHLILDQRFFHKKGERFVDPRTGKTDTAAFESMTRLEMYDAALAPPPARPT